MKWADTARAVIEAIILDVGTDDLDALEAAIEASCPFDIYTPDRAHRIWKQTVAAYRSKLRSSHAKISDDTKYFWVSKPADKKEMTMKILLIENADQDRFGIDTVIMFVPEDYEVPEVLEACELERPKIVEEIDFDLIWDAKLAPLVALGTFRGFMG